MSTLLAIHLVPFALVAFRVMGLFLAAPLIAGAAVPARVKVLLAVTLAAAVYPIVATGGPGGGPTGIAPASVGLFALVPMIAFEAAIGAAMGFLAGMPMHAANFAGFIMGHQMGLTLARTYDPTSEVETDLISQLLYILAAGAFLAIGGLEALFLGVATSFERIPAGGFRPDLTPLDIAVGLMGSSLELALRVSAPVLGIVSLILVALGVLGKTLPQINAMTVGFMLKIILGLTMIALGIVAMEEAIVEDVQRTLHGVLAWWDTVEPSPPIGAPIAPP
jgi:flagellar biosynthetic protein FliR